LFDTHKINTCLIIRFIRSLREYFMLTKFDKMKMRMFPYIKNVNLVKKLQIDRDSVHYISVRPIAEKITNIILKHLKSDTSPYKTKTMNKEVTITDATAGVGGDTISFSKNFFKVNAVEIDETRLRQLKNNIEVYDCKNVELIRDDYTKIYHKLDQFVVFLDPPWGGKGYREKKNLRLTLSDIHIEELCKKILLETKTYVIAIKIPLNYDLAYFYGELKNVEMVKRIYIYELDKMYILVVERNYKINQ
jgi:16S rRNA G966 N2-methylase RsmD